MKSSTRTRLLVLVSILAAPAVRAAAPPGDLEIRPFDKVFLKVSRNLPIVGIIESPGELAAGGAITIRTTSGVTSRVPVDRIDRVIPRQTAGEVYAKKLKSSRGIHDRARRAAAELDLGLWCKTPLAVLRGASPQPDKALEHLVNAVRLDPGLHAAYGHILALLDGSGPLETASPERVSLEVEVALLARRGDYPGAEFDFRLGVLSAAIMGMPARAEPFLVQFLEKERQAPEPNLGQLRKARSLLRDFYVKRGAAQKAAAMYARSLGQPPDTPENFEPLFELARIRARDGTADGERQARELLARAGALQPAYPGVPRELAALDYREGDLAGAEKRLKAVLAADATRAGTALDLALVLREAGKGKEALELLKKTAPQVGAEDSWRYHLVLGVLREDAADLDGAVAAYRKALAQRPDSGDLWVLLGFALVRAAKSDEAQEAADSLLALEPDSPRLFAAASWIRMEADLAAGREREALKHLERAVGVDRGNVPLLERAGILLLREGDALSGYGLLAKVRKLAPERPDTLNALACYHYGRQELEESRKLFDQVLRLTPAPRRTSGKVPPPVPPQRIYALQGLQRIEDFERLEVWSADLQGEDAPDLGGWQETERFGVEIARRGKLAVLAGRQAGEADGITAAMLERPVEAGTFARVGLEARIDSGKVRVGLRLEQIASRTRSVSGLVFFRDLDGILKVHVKTSRGEWVPVEPTEERFPERGRLMYPGATRWPDDGRFHTLEIRRSRQATSSRTRRPGAFDLYFDGMPVAWNVKVSGLSGLRYAVGFSGQTDAIGNEFSLSVKSFKIYRERPTKKKSLQRR